MTVELMYLTWVILFTAVLWMPYIVNAMAVRGLMAVIGYPDAQAPLSGWADRLKKAHSNAVENLVLFAPLVLLVHVTGTSNDMTAIACMAYFWARVGHAVVYTLAIPLLRTLTFAVGFVCQLVLGLTALGMM